jgi:hypothetical protein
MMKFHEPFLTGRQKFRARDRDGVHHCDSEQLWRRVGNSSQL